MSPGPCGRIPTPPVTSRRPSASSFLCRAQRHAGDRAGDPVRQRTTVAQPVVEEIRNAAMARAPIIRGRGSSTVRSGSRGRSSRRSRFRSSGSTAASRPAGSAIRGSAVRRRRSDRRSPRSRPPVRGRRGQRGHGRQFGGWRRTESVMAAIHIAVMPSATANPLTRNGGRRSRATSASAAIRSAVAADRPSAITSRRRRWRCAPGALAFGDAESVGHRLNVDKVSLSGGQTAKSMETAVRARRPARHGPGTVSVGGINLLQCAVEHRVPLVFRSKVGRGARAERFRLRASNQGSVPVQARDHRKRHCNQLSADSNQRDYAPLPKRRCVCQTGERPRPDPGIS